MGDYRKYACDISGSLFKSINKKGVRREKLSSELGISVNQLKNYAYDSTKSATLENFLCVLIKFKSVDTLDLIAKDMNCYVFKLPEFTDRNFTEKLPVEALSESAQAVSAYIKGDMEKTDISRQIRSAIEKLALLEKTLENGQ
ncbi:MAG: hypothetical protein C0602_01835 [Denitrovibrio sp.]|nr:MAG: hypothetical protein C0602_01835 [Denitrovibrio sp.]